MSSDGGCGQEVEGTTVGVGEGKERQHFIPFFKEFGTNTESDIAGKIVACQHYTFTKTGGSRCVVQQHNLVIGQRRVLDVFARESFRICSVHFIVEVYQKLLDGFSIPLIKTAEVGERKDSAQSGQLFFFQVFPDIVAGKQEDGFGMIDDVVHIVGRKVL